MARPLPVNLLLAGTGAVLLVSGLGGESIGEVLKGSFGELKKTGMNTNTSASAGMGEGGETPVTGEDAPSPTVYSAATFAPSPTTFSKKSPTPNQQAKGIARILYGEGITHPTNRQIEQARLRYEHETGVGQFAQSGEGAEEFLHGLPIA